MPGFEIISILKPHCPHDFTGAFDNIFLKIVNTDRFVFRDQANHQSRVLGCDSNRASVGVAFECLNATQGHHHSPG